jgi:hypothetical protein
VTKPLRQRDDFAVFTVSLDAPETDAALNDVIRKHGIDYPVIYDGGGWDTVQSKEWGVNSIPATFLIDPAGNIVATGLRGEALKPALDFFLNYKGTYAPIGMRSTSELNADGSVSLRLELSNPRHTPLHVKVDYTHIVPVFAEDDPEHKNRPVDYNYVEKNAEAAEEQFTVEFDDFGEAIHELTLPAVANASSVSYDISVRLPETESLAEGEGLWVSSYGYTKFEQKKDEAAAEDESASADEEASGVEDTAADVDAAADADAADEDEDTDEGGE